MNIVILGAGSIGTYIASILSKEEQNVILIDRNPKLLEKINKDLDIATVLGEGIDWRLLDNLRENEPHYFIALTKDDATNLTACALAKNLGYPQTICRVHDPSYMTRSSLDFGRLFYVDYFIAAELLTAHEILKSVISPTDLNVETFSYGAIQMRTIQVPENWARPNIPIHELSLPKEFIVGLIHRKVENQPDQIIFPHGEDHILPKDEITVVGETKMMYQLPDIFGTPTYPLQSIVIIGGSSVSLQLARILERQNISVKIIEKNEVRCHQLAEELQTSTIINHDGQDLNFLLAEKVHNSDALITCMKDDSSNLMIASLGKQAGCKKVISLISNTSLHPILRTLDITAYVSEKIKMANRILSIIHSETIISITSLCDDRAKVSEIKVSTESQIVGVPLSELSAKLPKDLLIAVIESHGQVMIGKGDKILSPGDTVIVISSEPQIHEMQTMF